MTRRVLLFGDCSLDVAARELRRAGIRIDLPPSVFDCIAYLVEHRQRAVGRDELVAAVWGKSAISDTMLGKAILAARRAVGDNAEAQALLRTVPRYGYHWVGAVRESGEVMRPPADAAAPPAPQEPQPAPRARRRWILAGLVALAIGAGWFATRRDATPVAQAPSVAAVAGAGAAFAVLPAEVLADAGDGWLRLGAMDLLASRLRDAGLGVVASDNVVRLVPADMPRETAITTLRGALDLRALVLPALRREGERWIVRIELLEADRSATRSVQAEAAHPIAATEEAARRLLALLGKRPATPAATASLDLAELLQRTDAARLSEDIDLAREVIAGAPAALRSLPEVRERGVRIDLRAGAFDRAQAALEALLGEVPAEADPVMHARLLEDLCVAQMRRGRLDEAFAACDEAIALLEVRNEPRALGRALNGRGILHARRGERDAALADFARSRVALTLAGEPLLLAQLDGNEATIDMARGRPAEALATLDRAGRTFQRFGMQNEFVTSLVNQVESHLMLLQPLAALQASDAGWSGRDRVTDPQVRHAFAQARAEALAANGRIGEARSVLDELQHADPPPAATQAAVARSLQAELELDAGAPAIALVLAGQAESALRGGPDVDRSRAWLARVRALDRLDRSAEAATEVAALTAWAAARQDPLVHLRASLARVDHAAAMHDPAQLATGCAEAGRVATQRGLADAIVASAVPCAHALIEAGDLEAATALVGSLGRHSERDFGSALVEARLYRALGRGEAAEVALARARRLAGERPIPAALSAPAAPLGVAVPAG